MFLDGFDFLDRIGFVYIVMTLIGTCLFGCVFTSILVVTLFIPVVHLPRRHMMCIHLETFTIFLCIVVISWHLSPGSRLFLFTCNKIINGIVCSSSILTVKHNDIPEESGHFRFLRAACLPKIKGSVGLILTKSLGHEDFHTTWLVIEAFYTSTTLHPL